MPPDICRCRRHLLASLGELFDNSFLEQRLDRHAALSRPYPELAGEGLREMRPEQNGSLDDLRLTRNDPQIWRYLFLCHSKDAYTFFNVKQNIIQVLVIDIFWRDGSDIYRQFFFIFSIF